MGQILVRRIDDAVLSKIKARAKANHRSAEAEVRELLTKAVSTPRPKRKKPLAGAGDFGMSPKEIADYIKGLREEWDR